LESVAFTSNTISFNFDDNVSITVESSIEHRVDDEGFTDVQCVPPKQSRLMQLVGQSIDAVSGDEKGTLTLHFDGGHVLCCFDDSPQFESYRISDGKDEIIV